MLAPRVWSAFIAATAGLALALTSAQAQTQAQTKSWPERPVRLLVPFGAGSATDVTARLFAERLSQRWGRPVTIENRPGGDSNIAATAFANARDDHTLLYSAPNLITVNPILYTKLAFDPARDLVPISMGSEIFVVVSVPASLKVDSMAELVKLAKEQPGKLNWVSTPGVVYFMYAGFLTKAGIDMTQVPYKDFTQAVNDLGEGRIQVTVSSWAVARPHAQAGRVRILAVTSDRTIPAAPDIPTVAKAGFKDLEFSAFGGFFGWRGMPDDLRERIAADIRAVGKDPAIADKLAGAGISVRTTTPAAFAAAIEDERSRVAAIAKTLGTKPIQ